MSREPDWFRVGYATAAGTKKSLMNLPEDFIILQSDRLDKDDFNVVKFAHEYAVNWLETEQWRQEVGQKIRKFIKKFPNDDIKVDFFMEKAFEWADGYARFTIDEFILFYICRPPEVRSRLSCMAVQQLVEQALTTLKQETGRKKYVTGRSHKSSG